MTSVNHNFLPLFVSIVYRPVLYFTFRVTLCDTRNGECSLPLPIAVAEGSVLCLPHVPNACRNHRIPSNHTYLSHHSCILDYTTYVFMDVVRTSVQTFSFSIRNKDLLNHYSAMEI